MKKNKKSNTEWRWTDVEQEVFDRLKNILSSPPVLAYPDFTLPFELHTDASTKALGAVLYQTQDGHKKVISYASRALNKAERNYSAFKLEFLALKWAVTEKFSDYLTANHFTVLTDNNPLTHILTSAKLDATGQRWASALGQFDFDISYRSGYKNADADAMSRYPHEKVSHDSGTRVVIENRTVKAICSATFVNVIETTSCNVNLLDIMDESGCTLAQKEMREIRSAQRRDHIIERWRKAVIDNKLPNHFLNSEDLAMRKQFKHFKIKRGILFRVLKDGDSDIEQLVVPEEFRNEILKGLHNDIGHPGQERMIRLLRDRFYWPKFSSDVANWVSKCDRCIRRKSKVDKAPLVNIQSTYPFELVCIDFLTLEPSTGNYGNVLVITDHYTKFAKAIPTKNQTAKTTAEVLYNEFFVNFGIPSRLHSDQGANFESETISELCKLMNIKKTHTSPYHPQGNAGPERFNRTLLAMLGTLEEGQKGNWKKYLNSLVYFYNCIPHEATKVSPFELMFGRKPKLPIDTVFYQVYSQHETFSHVDYVQHLHETMEHAHEIICSHVKDSQSKQKCAYDTKAKAVQLSIGDHVLVRKLAFRGKHKIQDKFEPDTYIVTDQPRVDIPVYKVKSSSGQERTLHRNHLRLLHHPDDADTVLLETEDQDKVECDTEVSNDADNGGDVTNEFYDDTDSDEDCSVYSTRIYEDAHTSEEVHHVDTYRNSDAEDDLSLFLEESTDGEDGDENPAESEDPPEPIVHDDSQPSLPDLQDSLDMDIVNNEPIPDQSIDRSPPTPVPRRSTRERRVPARLNDFVMYQLANLGDTNRINSLLSLVRSGVLGEVNDGKAIELVKVLIE